MRLDPERTAERLEPWRAIAQSACEQCGRNRFPVIEALSTIDHWLVAMKDKPSLKLMLSPVHATMFSTLPKPDAGAPITRLIGPEAGLSDAEEVLAQRAGFTPVLLGPRVMRTETAALAALAAIHARWGDSSGRLPTACYSSSIMFLHVEPASWKAFPSAS